MTRKPNNQEPGGPNRCVDRLARSSGSRPIAAQENRSCREALVELEPEILTDRAQEYLRELDQ